MMKLLEFSLALNNGVGGENSANNVDLHDVRAKSSAILSAFTILCFLDRWACLEWPLYRQHSMGIKQWGEAIKGGGDEDEDDLEAARANAIPGI